MLSYRRCSRIAYILLFVAIAGLPACTGMRPGFETPTVTFTSFRLLPSTGLAPEFEIGLRVTNPNAEQLKLRGMTYTASLDGRKLLTGAANDLPVIDGYGSGDVVLTAAPDVVAGIQFFSSLLSEQRDSVDYELEAKLDVGALIPAIRVRDKGSLSLRVQAR